MNASTIDNNGRVVDFENLEDMGTEQIEVFDLGTCLSNDGLDAFQVQEITMIDMTFLPSLFYQSLRVYKRVFPEKEEEEEEEEVKKTICKLPRGLP